jgi:hypothetical protein
VVKKMKKVSVPLSYIVLTFISLSLLVFSTACGSGGGGGFIDETPTPAPTATPGDGSTPTPTNTPKPTPAPVGRATPVPGPSPSPLPTWQGPMAPTATDKTGSWISNVYVSADGHLYMLILTNVPSTNYINLTWEEARLAASEKILFGKAGHLVTITSVAEQRAIMSTFDNCYGKTLSATTTEPVSAAFASGGNGASPLVGIALGGIREGNIWKWVTGENFDISTGYWLADYLPDNQGGSEDYLQIFTVLYNDSSTTARYGWNDYTGGKRETFGYIVEFEP